MIVGFKSARCTSSSAAGSPGGAIDEGSKPPAQPDFCGIGVPAKKWLTSHKMACNFKISAGQLRLKIEKGGP
jgi:hypothetical protein